MLFLSSCYKQRLKANKPRRITVPQWNEESTDMLQACLDCTIWEALIDPSDSLERSVDVVSSYINFCVDINIPTKDIVCYPNNKPWVSKELKTTLNSKKVALASGNKELIREANKAAKQEVAQCKSRYKDKVENLFAKNDSHSAWQGLSLLAGMKKKSSLIEPDCDDVTYADRLNRFFARFDTRDEGAELQNLITELRNTPGTCPQIKEIDVRNSFKRQRSRKAAGPDGIAARVLKTCADQLAPVYTKLYNRSLDICIVPTEWKSSTLVPIPKISLPVIDNDLRPVALTDLTMKHLEKLFGKNFLMPEVKELQDPWQFAYKDGVGVDDAQLTLTHTIQNHLDKPSTYVRTLYIDFSSAFNTISPLILARKLSGWNVNPYITLWTISFLTNRKQQVRYRGVSSSPLITNTGAPQGCVLSPVLFTLYTSECRATVPETRILKYADNTVIVGLLNKGKDESPYRNCIRNFISWCDDHCLLLNVRKTKEMILDFGTKYKAPRDCVTINNENVEIVKCYKYLGSIVDENLKWSENVHLVSSKASKRLWFLRKLRQCNVNNTILKLFYESTILSVLTFSITTWYSSASNLTAQEVLRIEKTALKIINRDDVKSIMDTYNATVCNKVSSIIHNDSHPLASEYRLLRSGTRLSTIKCRTARFNNTFIPRSIIMFNEQDTNSRKLILADSILLS
jgi:hypothetical protein